MCVYEVCVRGVCEVCVCMPVCELCVGVCVHVCI